MTKSMAFLDRGLASVETQAERAYAWIRQGIMHCEFQPGERLKISALAEEIGVSVGGIREALSRLTTEHHVVAVRQRGFRVSPLSRMDMLDLYSTRAALESDLVARSVKHASKEWKGQLASSYQALAKQSSNSTTDQNSVLIHEDFHRALVNGCGSAWSLRLFDTVYAASERYRSYAYKHLVKRRNPANEHKDIFDAALSGDFEKSRELIVQHTLLTRDLLDNALDKQSASEAA